MGVNIAADFLNFRAELDDSVDQLHEFLRSKRTESECYAH
jgi:hypothetical protein